MFPSHLPLLLLIHCLASVPVYDGTSKYLDFDNDLSDLSRHLTVFHGEVPPGSFVCIGHTVQAFSNREGQWSVSFNILWVIVLSLPS